MIGRRSRVRFLAEAVGDFSSPELTFCADSDSVSDSPPCYRSGTSKIFCQKSRWEVTHKQACTLDPTSGNGLTMLFRHSVGTYQGNELARSSSGKVCPQSPQFAELLWTSPCIKSGMCVHARKEPLPLLFLVLIK